MRNLTLCGLLVAANAFSPALTGAHAAENPSHEGIDVGKPSAVRNLVPAESLERSSAQQYAQMLQQAASQNALAPKNHPEYQRLNRIAQRLIPFTGKYNPRAKDWQWEVNLIGSKQVNAFCMPGGKIAFYTGLVKGLALSDDEIAIVMGHEVAHALREHARARMAKSQLTRIGSAILGEVVGRGKYAAAFDAGGNLLTLKFSRDDESEADLLGLDLAARAGYDPRAGVSLWQKMTAANRNAPPQWLSTHPAGDNRIKEIEKHLPEVLPLYEKARRSSTPAF